MIHFVGNSMIVEGDLVHPSTIAECVEYFKYHTHIAVDTETQGRDPHSKKILSLQIGDDRNQWVIDCRTINILRFKELLESKICIFHNAKFDYKFLKHAGILVENIYDTMLAECVIYCGYEKFGYSLKDVTLRYLNIDLDKSTRGEFYKLESEPFTDGQIEYAALDVTYLHQIMALQQEKITQYNLQYCVNLENEVVKALADIEYNGFILNKEKWLQNAISYEDKLKQMENTLDNIVLSDSKLCDVYKPKYIQADLFGYTSRDLDINYASPTQIKGICDTLGFQVDSTNDRELTKLAKLHPFFKELQNYRELAKVVSTYGKSFLNYINHSTSKVHTDFWQIKNTGRVSSGSKSMNACNVQNIPGDNKFRNCFEAREGFLWVSIDYNGQELRLMADGSKEKGFIDVLNRGEDLHCYAGSMMFKRTITKSDKELRNKAKTINFGKPYGMGPPKLADTLNITVDEANELFDLYAKSFPRLNAWLARQGKFAKENWYSTTFAPCYRKRWYPDMKIAAELRKTVQKGDKETWKRILTIEGQTERNGGNQPIQGSGADITKEALVEVRRLIQQYNIRYNSEVAFLICTVHDAIDCEVREDLAERFSKDMERVMIECGNKYVTDVKMEADITITKYWTK
jgi:DNA polymerase I-like protein with 3'-5' exonuclease and polymerase domains